MNGKNQRRKWIYLAIFVLSILFVFFLSRKFNPETGNRYWSFGTDGVQNFRKGLDVSGGTRLTYKISYDKYEQLYAGRAAELQQVKQKVEDILFKQIDERISSLGVADAKVYKQLMDGKTYINVDIGGISDLDQAKGIIGKTVELEFRLPHEGEPTQEEQIARKNLALGLHKELLENPDKFAELSENKGSQAIFYAHLTGVTQNEFPPMLKDNVAIIDALSGGEVANSLLTGVFTYNQIPNGSGQIALEPVSGYGIVLLNNKERIQLDAIKKVDVIDLAEKLGLEVTTEDEIVQEDPAMLSTYADGVYHLYEKKTDTKEKMYKTKAVFISPNLSGSGASVSVEEIQSQIKTADTFSGATLIMDDWKTEEEIKTTVANFDPDASEEIQTYEELGYTYILYISAIKDADEMVYTHTKVNNAPGDFGEQLTNKASYDIEITFIQDKEPWVLAKTKNNKILNGAYFKFANPGVSQLGESVVEINFNDEGKQIFCDITNENIGRQMAIFVGGELMTNPVINTKICGGSAQISGSYTPETAKELSDNLNDGALPAPLILLQEEKISPLLGDNALNHALLAGLIGIIAIFFFVLILYGVKKATVTLGVLIMFLLSLGFFMKVVDYSLSLSAIAAVILSIGMAVDANILIFERIREELSAGKKMGAAIDVAYERSWSAIKDGNISTGIIAFLLFSMGNSIFKGFGSMLIVTVLLTLFMNVPLTKILLKYIYRKEIKTTK